MAIARYDGVTPVVASLVTVYLAGTQSPATIYADDLLTPLGNPFTSDALTGAYTFFADDGVSYDIVLGTTGTPTPAPTNPSGNFGILAVAGQDPIEADITHDAFGLAGGVGIEVTTDPDTKIATIAATAAAVPADTVADLDGTGDAGASTEYSRGDHRHADANRPSDDEKAALAGTSGTPGVANPYVTNADARNTDARATHVTALAGLIGTGSSGSPLSVAVDGITVTVNGSGQLVATTGGTGDVVGPAGATAGHVATFNGATGKVIQDGGFAPAPADADYVVETANGNLSAEVVLGTTVVTTAVLASRQSAAKAGRLFYPSNGYYIYRDTGAAWSPWGPIFACTEPVDGNFTWLNQGAASVDTTNGGVYLLTASSAAVNIRGRYVAGTIAGNWTLVVGFIPFISVAESHGCGILARQSSDGKLVTLGLFQTTQRIAVSKWTSATAFSADYALSLAAMGWSPGTLVWLKMEDNGTNRLSSISIDGQHWLLIHSIGRTDFLTVDQVGVFVYGQNANTANQTAMLLLHYLRT